MSSNEKNCPNLGVLDTPWFMPYKKSILATGKPTAEILLQPSDNLNLRQSKLGGLPYLPQGVEYPCHPKGHPLILLLQINFAEMPPLPDFPNQGILQWFIDTKSS